MGGAGQLLPTLKHAFSSNSWALGGSEHIIYLLKLFAEIIPWNRLQSWRAAKDIALGVPEGRSTGRRRWRRLRLPGPSCAVRPRLEISTSG
jgi:hypothetical protein